MPISPNTWQHETKDVSFFLISVVLLACVVFFSQSSCQSVLVTLDQSLLWTDARYHVQAEMQLGKEWTLMKAGKKEVPTVAQWIAKETPEDCTIGIDAVLVSLGTYRALKEQIGKRNLVPTEGNFVDKVWEEEQSLPENVVAPIKLHKVEYAGQSWAEKVNMIRCALAQESCSAHVVCALDCIAWLFNLRGSDIEFNPVFRSYAVVTNESVFLFIESENLLSEEAKGSLTGVTIKPYSSIFTFLHSLEGKVWIDPNVTSYAIFTSLSLASVYEKDSPIVLAKAKKNLAEVSGMRNAHIRDAAAMCIFLNWLETSLKNGHVVTECTLAEKLEEYRSREAFHVGPSFETIAGFGSNGAIIHYRALPATCKTLTLNDMFLLDSGAQYADGGTTDITRTLHFGEPTAWHKECYTRVLQGHIDLAMAQFPLGTVGPTLDVIARLPLWKGGLDYRHGTGHGVGSYLNVHEGPHGIGATVRRPEMLQTAMQVGMCVSNEPGYYEAGNFGVRIESVMTVKQIDRSNAFENATFLGFETLTIVPYQLSLIDQSLLSGNQIKWLNDFHAHSLKMLAPLLEERNEIAALEWLKRSTLPL